VLVDESKLRPLAAGKTEELIPIFTG